MEKERRTGTLTRTNRPLETYLTGLGFDTGTVTNSLTWGNKLEADAQRWLARGGFGERGRISKSDARRLLQLELSALAGGGE